MVSVLVVDDSPLICKLLAVGLSHLDYTVSTVEHGGPALAHLRSSAERMVVLLGLNMPSVDGEAVLRALAVDPALAARHRFIMLSADERRATSDPVAALRAQLGVPFIAKPFTMDAIFDAVAQAAQQIGAP